MGGDADRIRLEPSWKARLGDWLLRPEMRALAEFLRWADHTDTQGWPPTDAG